jgi:hypothetical protein
MDCPMTIANCQLTIAHRPPSQSAMGIGQWAIASSTTQVPIK